MIEGVERLALIAEGFMQLARAKVYVVAQTLKGSRISAPESFTKGNRFGITRLKRIPSTVLPE